MDFDHYLVYFLSETSKGMIFCKQAFLREQSIIIVLFCILLIGILPNGQSGILVIVGIFTLVEILYFFFNKFNPKFHAAKRALRKELKIWSQRQWNLLERQRKIQISQEWLEISTFDSNHLFHWNMVEDLAIKSDYIFIEVTGPYILPKRDFPSEEIYLDFGKLIMEYWESGKNKPISAELRPAKS
jgi:hypothetical protein